MKLKTLVTVAALAFAVPAFAKDVAVVNGKSITEDDVEARIKAFGVEGKKDSDQLRQFILMSLIDEEILNQEAVKKGLDKTPEFKYQLESSKKELLNRAALQDWMKTHKVSEEDVKKEYQKIVDEYKDAKQYKVRHILVKDEAKAKELLKKIQSKKISFADAAKESIDTGSAADGGKLGWSSPDQFVPEFADAIKKAKKDELLKEPVKTSFGWHIIKVDGIRDTVVPELKELEPEIKQRLIQNGFKAHMQELHKSANIELKGDAANASDATDKTPATDKAADKDKSADADKSAATEDKKADDKKADDKKESITDKIGNLFGGSDDKADKDDKK